MWKDVGNVNKNDKTQNVPNFESSPWPLAPHLRPWKRLKLKVGFNDDILLFICDVTIFDYNEIFNGRRLI